MKIREIILDTETTGIDPKKGHKIIEIGCVEVIDKLATNNFFHYYLNPQRAIDEESFAVHGLSKSFLQDKPLFKDISQEFLDFIAQDPLVIHNAGFDVGFINAELAAINNDLLQNEIIDTIAIARNKFPGARISLNELCKRFNIDISSRKKHGALLDAELLSAVYLELCGGKQVSLDGSFVYKEAKNNVKSQKVEKISIRKNIKRNFQNTKEELEIHKNFITMIKNTLWLENEQ